MAHEAELAAPTLNPDSQKKHLQTMSSTILDTDPSNPSTKPLDDPKESPDTSDDTKEPPAYTTTTFSHSQTTTSQPTPYLPPIASPRISQCSHPLRMQGSFADIPVPITCPATGQPTITVLEYHSGTVTWLWAAGICVTVGCGCIPFFIDRTKDVKHVCSACKTHLATYHRGNGRIVVYDWGR